WGQRRSRTRTTAPRPIARSRSSVCASARPPDRVAPRPPVHSQPPMVSERDYYEVLAVERGADDAAIKRAFRKLAQQWHPDVNTEPEAQERFKEINEAYQVLSDPTRRQAYDMFGKAGVSGAGGDGGAAGFGGFSDIFDAFFGGAVGGGHQPDDQRPT